MLSATQSEDVIRRRILSRVARVATWVYAIVGIGVLILILVWVLAWSSVAHVS